MPRKLELTWFAPGRCWKKYGQGKVYCVGKRKCRGKSDALGYQAARVLDQIRDLWIQANQIPDESAAYDWFKRRACYLVSRMLRIPRASGPTTREPPAWRLRAGRVAGPQARLLDPR